jgi:glycosyltransferase involved in cell wall biosynthesis
MRIGIMMRHMEGQIGGVATYTLEVLEHMFKIDSLNEFVLFYKTPPPRHQSFTRFPNVEEVVVRFPTKILWDQVAMPIKIREKRIDILFNPKLTVPILTSCKSVFVRTGGDWYAFPQNYPLLDRIYFTLAAPIYLHKAAAIVSISNCCTEQLLHHTSLNPKKLVTIYPGVAERYCVRHDEERLRFVKERYDLPDQFMLFVGKIYPMKNFARILLAFHEARKRRSFKFVFVGKPFLKYKKELRIIDNLGLEKEVIQVGWVPDEDLPSFYQLATFLSFPSLYEGFGFPIIEAMASGCPVLTSDRGGATAEVAGGAALLVHPTNVNSIAGGMYQMISDETLRQDLREKGLRRARDFSWENCSLRTLALLGSVAKEE